MKPMSTNNTLESIIIVSVLNREPMGMKPTNAPRESTKRVCFSAQPRADGDEAQDVVVFLGEPTQFQCSTASRWG